MARMQTPPTHLSMPISQGKGCFLSTLSQWTLKCKTISAWVSFTLLTWEYILHSKVCWFGFLWIVKPNRGSVAANLQCMMLAYYELFVVVCSVCPVVCPPQTLIVKPRLQERLQWNSFMNHFASSAFELWLVPLNALGVTDSIGQDSA